MNEKTKTKGEVVKELGLEDIGVIDYALPKNWVDDIADKIKSIGFTYDDVISSFVWFYPHESNAAFSDILIHWGKLE